VRGLACSPFLNLSSGALLGTPKFQTTGKRRPLAFPILRIFCLILFGGYILYIQEKLPR
jgi:hypothetical protein